MDGSGPADKKKKPLAGADLQGEQRAGGHRYLTRLSSEHPSQQRRAGTSDRLRAPSHFTVS